MISGWLVEVQQQITTKGSKCHPNDQNLYSCVYRLTCTITSQRKPKNKKRLCKTSLCKFLTSHKLKESKMFCLHNHKFQHEARKAVFSELSMQLEFCAEDLTLDTELSVFDEMLALVTELKIQATSHRVNKPVDPMQRYKDIPVSIKFETPSEVSF